jgi:hypothetical protein
MDQFFVILKYFCPQNCAKNGVFAQNTASLPMQK